MGGCKEVQRTLRARGMLLRQDKLLPSVVGIITGEPLAASWWSHPQAHEIFDCLGRLGDAPDVLVSRLIGGKVTYIHRRLWPAFLAVATSGEPWQTRGLTAEARRLLTAVRRGRVQRATGSAARALQERLLIHAEEIHTESGRHALVLQTWASRVAPGDVDKVSATLGREQLERVVRDLEGTAALLPWHRFE